MPLPLPRLGLLLFFAALVAFFPALCFERNSKFRKKLRRLRCAAVGPAVDVAAALLLPAAAAPFLFCQSAVNLHMQQLSVCVC